MPSSVLPASYVFRGACDIPHTMEAGVLCMLKYDVLPVAPFTNMV